MKPENSTGNIQSVMKKRKREETGSLSSSIALADAHKRLRHSTIMQKNPRPTVMASIEYVEQQLSRYHLTKNARRNQENQYDILLDCLDEMSGNTILLSNRIFSSIEENHETNKLISRLGALIQELHEAVTERLEKEVTGKKCQIFPEEGSINDFIKMKSFEKLLEFYWICTLTRLEFGVADSIVDYLDNSPVSSARIYMPLYEQWQLRKLVISIYEICHEERKRLERLYVRSDIEQHVNHSSRDLRSLYIPSDEVTLTNAMLYQYTRGIQQFYKVGYLVMTDMLISRAEKIKEKMGDDNPLWSNVQSPEVQQKLADYNDSLAYYNQAVEKIKNHKREKQIKNSFSALLQAASLLESSNEREPASQSVQRCRK